VDVTVCDFYNLHNSLKMVPSELKHVTVWYNIDD